MTGLPEFTDYDALWTYTFADLGVACAIDASERGAYEDDWPDWDGDVLHMDGPERG